MKKTWNKYRFLTIHTTKKSKKSSKENQNKLPENKYWENIKKFLAKLESYKKERTIKKQKLKYKFGEVMEIDAQQEAYLKNGEKVYLYHAIDVATGLLLAVWFATQETNLEYQKLFEMIFKNFGFPKKKKKKSLQIVEELLME